MFLSDYSFCINEFITEWDIQIYKQLILKEVKIHMYKLVIIKHQLMALLF